MSAPKVQQDPFAKPIKIGIPIWLKILLETRLAILATSGAGKSYLIRVLTENIADQVQQIILDVEGEFVSLREKFNLLLIGKEGADIPINVQYAETMAHRLLKTGISAIVDLSDVDAEDRLLFVKKFGEGMLNSPKEYRHAVMLYLSEAQVFAPQDGSAISTKTIINLANRGRKRGICLIVDSQRSSILNKNVLAPCGNKIIGRTTYDDDMKRSAKELGFTTKEDILSIRKLKKGEFYAYGPAISEDVVKFHTIVARTSHGDSGLGAHTNPPTPAAIKKILGELADIPEEAEKDLQTKKQYQDEIRRLQEQVKSLQKDKTTGEKKGAPVTAVQSSSAAANKLATALRQKNDEFQKIILKQDGQIKSLQKEGKAIQSFVKKIQENADHIIKTATVLTTVVPIQQLPAPPLTGKKPSVPVSSVTKRSTPKGDVDSEVKLGKGHRSLLTALAMYYPEKIPRSRAAFIAGISPKGGHCKNLIGECKRNDWLVVQGDQLCITDNGLEALDDYTPLPTDGDDIVTFWAGKLGKGAAGMLRTLHAAYPKFISREELGTQTNISHDAGHFKNCLGELRTLGLIEEEGKTLRLSTQLFE